jgi:multiple sugar transport system permease protein
MVAETQPMARRVANPVTGRWTRLIADRNFLSLWFMLPAATILLLFLAYPLGLGIYLSATDTTIGRRGVWIGLENFEYLLSDPYTRRDAMASALGIASLPTAPEHREPRP